MMDVRQIEAARLEHLGVFFRTRTLTRAQIAFAKRSVKIHYHPFLKGMTSIRIFEIISGGAPWHLESLAHRPVFNPKPSKGDDTLRQGGRIDAGGDTTICHM